VSKPAARVGDMHTCPMVTPAVPPVPHVGGPILPPGCPTVLIGGLPAARLGDMAVCVGPPDSIAMGSPTVLIGGRPAARMGDPTMHGGVITLGFPMVLIGEASSGAAGSPSAGAGAGYPRAVALPGGGYMTQVSPGVAIQGDPAFQAQVMQHLDRLAATPTGTKLLASIDSSGKTVTIVKSAGGNTESAKDFNAGLRRPDGKPGAGTDATVKFNPDRTQIGDGSKPWMKRSPTVGLAHEMIHGAHDCNGTTEFDYGDSNKVPQNYELQTVGLSGTKNGRPVEYSGNEYTENKVRTDLGEPLRDEY
jgi:uncharacterized Zn-binding protein involved in type VI secretion